MSMTSLYVSTGIIVAYCAAAEIARKIVARRYQQSGNDGKGGKSFGVIPILFYEAVAAAELCACCFELIIVADNFGVASYAVYLFLLTVWWNKVWGDASACPYIHMEGVVEGKLTFKEMALRIWAELMGGCCVYRIVQIFWWFEFAETHQGRVYEECSADLQVNPYVGAAVEGFATLLCRLASKALNEKDAKFCNIIDSFVGTSLVVAAFNFSGGYFNPVLATALKWGCRGHTNFEHIIVYWIGSCSGAILSVPLFKMPSIRKLLLGTVKDKTA